jgi:hypothetical protein
MVPFPNKGTQDGERMKWFEWIKVQTANLSETTLDYICGLTKGIVEIPGLAIMEVYVDAVVSGNVALLIVWEIDPPQPRGSVVGLQLAGELKEVGLVAHSVWICKE